MMSYQCERCGGTGQQPDGCWDPAVELYTSPAGPCLACGGSGRLGVGQLTREAVLALPAGRELDGLVDELVFAIDRRANTPERITAALHESWESDLDDGTRLFCWNDTTHWIRWDPAKYGSDPSGAVPWFWHDRAGRPWQADIEAHVAAWRAPPSRAWSTDIAAAWAVVERLASAGWNVELIRVPGGHVRDPWMVRFLTLNKSRDADADTAPLAICKAALLAVLG